MPTADSFTALGRGNGFPFCATKKDVSGFDNWITLGGVSGGSASQSEIDESLANAMKLWWNLNSITGSFSASGASTADGGVSESAADYELILIRSGESDPLAPSQRSCRGTSSSTQESERDKLESIFYENDSSGSNEVSGSLKIGGNDFIVKMYNGSTDDEDNFVGYGVTNLALSSAGAFAGSSMAGVDVVVGSYQSGKDDSGQDPDTGINFDLKVFQTTLDDIPFRSKSVANAHESGGAFTLSTSELSASATANSSATGPPATTSSVNASTSLSTSMDFYTY